MCFLVYCLAVNAVYSLLSYLLLQVVILVTNGNSHPSVTIDDIEVSIQALRAAGIKVLPVAVTRECQ